MSFLTAKSRYDSVIIWGHGIQYCEEIIDMIRNVQGFEIARVVKYRPRSMKRFIRKVYSYDYAPIGHLKSKIKYLEKVDSNLLCIVINNSSPEIDILGEGSFRHEECLKLKQLKTKIRERFNPHLNGEMTHNHVIHATDNEEQTHHILKAVGDKSVSNFYTNNFFSVPFFLGQQEEYQIELVSFDDILCGQAEWDSLKFEIVYLPVKDSIQYLSIGSDGKLYKEYVKKYLGTALKSYYHVDKFLGLAQNFTYLSSGHEASYVVVRKSEEGKYIIQDGLHRAALHHAQGNNEIKVCVIK
jgi:hypothetical protein